MKGKVAYRERKYTPAELKKFIPNAIWKKGEDRIEKANGAVEVVPFWVPYCNCGGFIGNDEKHQLKKGSYVCLTCGKEYRGI